MGQAKQRGTFEERKHEATLRRMVAKANAEAKRQAERATPGFDRARTSRSKLAAVITTAIILGMK